MGLCVGMVVEQNQARKYILMEPSESLVYLGAKHKNPNILNLIDLKTTKSRLLNPTNSRSEMHQRLCAIDEASPLKHAQMESRFDDLYKKIAKISWGMQEDIRQGKHERRYHLAPNEHISETLSPIRKPFNMMDSTFAKIGSRSMNGEYPEQLIKRRKAVNMAVPDSSGLNIGSPAERKGREELVIKYLKSTASKMRMKIPNKSAKMSNSIRDYLSVEKIRIKDLESSMIARPTNKLYESHSTTLNDYCNDNLAETLVKEVGLMPPKKREVETNFVALNKMNGSKSIQFRTTKAQGKFSAPFETYYYRDLIWKIAYSNEQILEMPAQYESKIRVFIGRGNNSRLVRSIISRRTWYQVTDRIEDATVVWTQIKVSNLFNGQFKNKEVPRRTKQFLKEDIEGTGEETAYNSSIWSARENKLFSKYFFSFRNAEERLTEAMAFRIKHFQKILKEEPPKEKSQQKGLLKTKGLSTTTSGFLKQNKMQNHFINSYIIGNKKALFQTMSNYYSAAGEDVFKYLPMTFHVCNGLEDDMYLKFLNFYYAIAKATTPEDHEKFNAWIVKPGENTNRGQGITVCLTLDAVKNILKKREMQNDGSYRTYIIQKYIERPLLYKRRKFDLRHYIMLNCSNGLMKGYWFKEGYVRTTSSEYSLRQGLSSVHLTNDAVQKNLPDYGKYEKGNKISYEELHNYLSKLGKGFDFFGKAYPRMKKIGTDIMKASALSLDPERRNNFEIYGIDFMLDQNLDVWLIEVNTNPCLEISCPLLSKIIPKMIENTLQIAIDPQYPPPVNFNPKSAVLTQNCLQQMSYELVYDERFEQRVSTDMKILYDEKLRKEEDDCFDDDGEDWNDD